MTPKVELCHNCGDRGDYDKVYNWNGSWFCHDCLLEEARFILEILQEG